MINLTASKKTDTINVNVKPITHINVGDNVSKLPVNAYSSLESEVSPDQSQRGVMNGGMVSNGMSDRKVAYEDWDFLVAENKVLKLVIQMLQSNPLIVNKFIIADDEVLQEFVQTLTAADDVQIDAEDVGQGCLSTKTYRKVHNIFVIKDGETKNLKYDYPKVIKTLLDLRISTKFVW